MSSKAYSESEIFNAEVRRTARRWHQARLLTTEQVAAIGRAFPGSFYEPHLFVRVVLFLFTCFGAIMSSGLVFLFVHEVGNSNSNAAEIQLLLGCLLCGGVALALLEALIQGHHYRSGADNALLYGALLYGLGALGFFYALVLPSSALDPELLLARGMLWALLLPVLALLLAAVVRYADPLLAALSLVVYLGVVAALLLPFGMGKVLLPFGLMLACVGSYQAGQRLARRPDYLYYRTCLRTVKALSLAGFYLAGNYLVVREVNAALNNLPYSVQISLAPLFYLFTAAIPLVYITWGLRRADRIFLYVGLLALAFSLYTYRYYRAVLPPELAMTLGGLFLIGFAGWALRYLKPGRHGLTALPADSPAFSTLNLESVLLAHVTENTLDAPERGFEFGGGTSGGGGAAGKW